MGQTEFTTIGGGCFWCMEAVFERLKGVLHVTSGYAGGYTENPGYKDVCTGNTGHAEVIQIAYDPGIISFKDILVIFFKAHDPTTVNRQGADVGTQYRSIILYHTKEQKEIAENYINERNKSGLFTNDIVTEIKPLVHFYQAEEYHQNYFKKHPDQAYCRIVITPKLEKLDLVE
ncbi:MAG: peptide-methionine (S)-S-oxide reductase MsrA [Spirochaetales bacterium]|nr:peptide-methionine (S)-S-oxide reductase MsrA [Spirochaetales bacterium]